MLPTSEPSAIEAGVGTEGPSGEAVGLTPERNVIELANRAAHPGSIYRPDFSQTFSQGQFGQKKGPESVTSSAT